MGDVDPVWHYPLPGRGCDLFQNRRQTIPDSGAIEIVESEFKAAEKTLGS
jgi:hypothetical protein